MATLQELLAQKEAIEKEIAHTQSQQRGEAIAKVHSLMSEHGLSMSDLSVKNAVKNAVKISPSAGAKVPAKYRNTTTGETWSGRGLQPKWLKAAVAAGKTLGDFAV